MVIDLPIAQEAKKALDFIVADRAAETDAVDVAHWDKHGRVVCDDTQMVEPAGRPENRLLLDSFHDAQTMIRVDDLVADFKCHGSPCWKRGMEGRNRASSPFSIAEVRGPLQREMPKKWPF